ncbi:MAG: hypothetical protein AB1938_20430 [Myxococcota bacterium]
MSEDNTAPEQKDAQRPGYGPDWDAAVAWGIDVSLLERNLALTVEQRLLQLHEMSRLYELLRPHRADEHAEHS